MQDGKMKRQKETKIVILGSYDSGKTTTLECICQENTKIDYKGTTIALDYGNTFIGGEKIHLFGSPGQERFRFMREILSEGLDGAIVVIDNCKGVTPIDQEILERLHQDQVPYVVFANKQDLHSGELEIGFEAPIIPTIAREGDGVMGGLELLLEMVNSG
jgi:small GTP-binding protein